MRMSEIQEIEELLRRVNRQNEELAKSLKKLHFWTGAMLWVLGFLLITMVLDFVFLDK